jgi:hypothetical protein
LSWALQRSGNASRHATLPITGTVDIWEKIAGLLYCVGTMRRISLSWWHLFRYVVL